MGGEYTEECERSPSLYSLVVIQNCQHYQQRIQSTIFCDPLPSYQKSTLKMLTLRPLLKSQCTENDNFKNRLATLDLLPLYAAYACENDDNSGRPVRCCELNTQAGASDSDDNFSLICSRIKQLRSGACSVHIT